MVVLHNQVLDGIDAAILVVDREGSVLYANGRAGALAGRDLTGINLRERDFSEEDPAVGCVLECCRRGLAAPGASRELVIATGEDRIRYQWVSVSAEGAAGEDRIVMVVDISEPLCAAPSIRKVFSQVNHDLRSPLTSIAGAAELLLSGRVGSVDGAQRRLIRIVEEGTQRMSDILRQTKNELAKEAQAAGGDAR